MNPPGLCALAYRSTCNVGSGSRGKKLDKPMILPNVYTSVKGNSHSPYQQVGLHTWYIEIEM